MKIFCIGFQKTGTKSLKQALQMLGYRVTGPNGIHDPDIAAKVHAMAESLVARYDAFQDNPWPIIYKEMDARYPNSKFILTIRETDSWYKSARNHFKRSETPMRVWIYGVGAPVGNRETFVSRYERHNKEVLDYFRARPGDLLVMDLARGDGWDALCRFLGKPVQQGQFPHANTPAERKARREAVTTSSS